MAGRSGRRADVDEPDRTVDERRMKNRRAKREGEGLGHFASFHFSNQINSALFQLTVSIKYEPASGFR